MKKVVNNINKSEKTQNMGATMPIWAIVTLVIVINLSVVFGVTSFIDVPQIMFYILLLWPLLLLLLLLGKPKKYSDVHRALFYSVRIFAILISSVLFGCIYLLLDSQPNGASFLAIFFVPFAPLFVFIGVKLSDLALNQII